MESASTLAAYAKRIQIALLVAAGCFLASCSSPLDLDVERTSTFLDGSHHPTRISLYYYYGSSGWEAVVRDTAVLNHIWLEFDANAGGACFVTVPQFIFTLSDSILPTPQFTPFVRTFSFGTTRQSANAVETQCLNQQSWVAGAYISTQSGQIVNFRNMTDLTDNRLGVTYRSVPGERLVKGTVSIQVVDPETGLVAQYRALLTFEF